MTLALAVDISLSLLVLAVAAWLIAVRDSVAAVVGFVAYGLSIYFYILAQRSLGAAKTSTYYALAPFMGVILSLILFTSNPLFFNI